MLLVDDDGVLAALVACWLGEDDALVFGLGDCVPEAEDEAGAEVAPCAGDGLVQVGCGLGRSVLVGDAVGLGLLLLLGLPLGLLVADGVPVVVGLGLLLGVGVPVVVGLGLGLGLVVLPLLGLPPDDVGGAVGVWVALLDELVVLCAADECAEGDVQAVVLEPGTTTEKLDEPPPGETTGVLLGPDGPLELLAGLPLVRAAVMALPTFIIAWRAGGTKDRTTPMANTVTPTAKAGRSIASRQSLGRFGARPAPP